jgi:hypothetical protein
MPAALWGQGTAPAAAGDATRVVLSAVEVSLVETIRLSVRAQAHPPSPCRLILAFLDSAGHVADAGSAQREVVLGSAGDAGVLSLTGVQVAISLGVHAVLRPSVAFPPSPCADARLVATVELVGALGLVTVAEMLDVSVLVVMPPGPPE